MTAVLKHRTLAAAIVDRLRESILDGSHAAGAQLAAGHASRKPTASAAFRCAKRCFSSKPRASSAWCRTRARSLPSCRSPRSTTCSICARCWSRACSCSRRRCSTTATSSRSTILHARFVAAIADKDVTQWGLLNADFHLRLYEKATLPRTHAIVSFAAPDQRPLHAHAAFDDRVHGPRRTRARRMMPFRANQAGCRCCAPHRTVGDAARARAQLHYEHASSSEKAVTRTATGSGPRWRRVAASGR